MDPLAIALGLARIVPAIAGWIGGDGAEKIATTVVDVAKQVAGIENPKDALAQIESDPELQIRFQQAIAPIAIARLQNEATQQAEINATMRAEIKADDKFKSYWRPALGWAVVISFTSMMLSIVFVIMYGVFKDPKIIKDFVSAISELMGTTTVIWSMALAVLGVNISKRSQDKALAAGVKPTDSIIRLLAQQWQAKKGNNNGR